jgi:hypothetical protein
MVNRADASPTGRAFAEEWAVDAFTYSRTLERSSVHRRSVSEVFLTDFAAVGERVWMVGAQLPSNHGYFTDHTGTPETSDLLLLLECCRQASTYCLPYSGCPENTANIVNSFSIRLLEPELLQLGSRPVELNIRVSMADIIYAGKKMRRARFVMDLFFGLDRVGEATISATFVTPALYRAIRSRPRGGEAPPLTSTLRDVPLAMCVAPELVGRRIPANVVVSEVYSDSSGASAELALSPGNRSILDHDYDHIPAMALVEAARQVGVHMLGAQSCVPVGLRASFIQFAEVDSSISLKAAPTVAARSGGREGSEVEVEVIQSDETIASIVMTYRKD